MYRMQVFKHYNTLRNSRYGLMQQHQQLKTDATIFTSKCKCCGLHQQVQFADSKHNAVFRRQLTTNVLSSSIAARLTTMNIAAQQQVRTQSTTPTQVEQIPENHKKAKRRSHNNKYVDLIEVTKESVNLRKSRVQQLKAKKLQKFIVNTQKKILDKCNEINKANKDKRKRKEPEVTVARFPVQPIEYQKVKMESIDTALLETGVYDDKPMIFLKNKTEDLSLPIFEDQVRIQNILKSFQNFRDIIESMEHERHETDISSSSYNMLADANSDAGIVHDPLDSNEPFAISDIQKKIPQSISSAEHTTNVEKTVARKSKSRYKSKIHINEESERLAKERALRINLNTYLKICVNTGLLNRGLSVLIAYRQRAQRLSKNSLQNIISIDLYNILLHGLAEKGSFERFTELFQMIADDGLKFNEQTYAATFECLGRLEDSKENKKLIANFIKEAEQKGFTLHEIMDRSKFVADQRDIALDAIRRIQPNFVPIYTPPILEYDNSLLNKLNENIEPVDTIPATQTQTVNKDRNDYKSAQLQEMAREQLKIELEGRVTIKSIEKTKEFANADFCRSKLQELEQQWRVEIASSLARDMNTLRAQVRFKPHGNMSYYTYLRTLDTAQYTDILMQEITKLAEGSETYSPTVGQLYKELGMKVQQKFLIEQKKQNGLLEKIGDVYAEYCDQWTLPETSIGTDNTRQKWQRIVHAQRQKGPSMDICEVGWPTNVLIGVGRFLYNILMRDIKIDAFVMRQTNKSKQQNILPAFYTLFRNHGRLVKEEVKPHPVLARLLRASKQQTLTFDSNLVPMLCPPQPWSTPHNGGYLLNRSDLIRLPHQAIQQWERINNAPAQKLYPALDSLNQLASIPWRVNTDILDVIIEVFQSGGNDKLDVPRPPSALPPLPNLPDKNLDINPAERAKLFKEKMGHRRKQAEMYSLWCDTLYRLSLANHYRDKVFWLPHNMDFRGRVYPLPPHLNHLGSDLARSMLVFNEERPLGVDGFMWLKLHCINLTGLKKRQSVKDRLIYAEKMMSEILDSADNPLTGRMWWVESDEPWQTLACCKEIAKVLRSDNHEEYMSRFPIHQDGSCNGLQHYAALGRDKSGAISVNLAPASVPQDVYSAVAALVEKTRKDDAKNGLHVAQALEGFVRRKVIKQTVMTTVYGVTRYGARLQIARQLKDIDEFPRDWVWPASTYLTTKTFESLREMFTSTREIQDWFTECARLIASICGKNVEWVTPLGLPVVQPYNRQESKIVARSHTRVQETMAMDMYERPNVLKQKNAFPPNFIHSLDSSHMMLTSLYCERAGITFISVHDCFWTHACSVPDMNKICREQFVALHSQSILEDLGKSLHERYSFKEAEFNNDGSSAEVSKRHLNRVLRQLPQKGDFDLRQVLDSVYFFS